MHDRHAVERVIELHAAGENTSHIARATGVARSTVRDWVAGRLPYSASVGAPEGCDRGPACLAQGPLMLTSYAYMLGLYLGDGCLSQHPRNVYKLRIFLDSKYPELVFECRMRMQILCQEKRISTVPMSGGARGVVVQSYSKHWPCLFPQHGAGAKHTRPISLAKWQRDIVQGEPELFLRGLIHSDGCRNINNRGRGSSWTGVRYLFSNRSPEILLLFADTCDQLGIHWTAPSWYTISIARRADTARLDEFVGPKQ